MISCVLFCGKGGIQNRGHLGLKMHSTNMIRLRMVTKTGPKWVSNGCQDGDQKNRHFDQISQKRINFLKKRNFQNAAHRRKIKLLFVFSEQI